MIESVKELLAGNQFISGSVFLGIATSILYSLKSVPGRIWAFIERKFKFTVRVEQGDRMFEIVTEWMVANHADQMRSLSASYNFDIHGASYYHANDTFFFNYKGRYISFKSTQEKMTNASSLSSLFVKSYELSGMFAKTQIMDLIDEAIGTRKEKEQVDRKILLRENYGDSWNPKNGYATRSMDSIALDDQTKSEIIKLVSDFESDKSFYNIKSIPYRLGILLEGPPGTGKSSLASAISTHFKRDLYSLNLTTVNDYNFRKLVSDMDPGSILLLEDVDRVFHGDQPVSKDYSHLKFGTLINTISGVNCKEDVIVIMTCNDVTKLDPALIRKGRMDKSFHIGKASHKVIQSYVRRFFDDEGICLAPLPFSSMAEVEHICLHYKRDKESALREILSIDKESLTIHHDIKEADEEFRIHVSRSDKLITQDGPGPSDRAGHIHNVSSSGQPVRY